MTKRASIRCFSWFTNYAIFVSNVLLVPTIVNAFFASLTLSKISSLVTFFHQVLGISFNFNNLTAVVTFSEHYTIFPEVHIHVFILCKVLVGL